MNGNDKKKKQQPKIFKQNNVCTDSSGSQRPKTSHSSWESLYMQFVIIPASIACQLFKQETSDKNQSEP